MGRPKSRRQPRCKPERQPYIPPNRGVLADGVPTLYEQRPAGEQYRDWVDTSGVDMTRWLRMLRERAADSQLGRDEPEMADGMEFYAQIYGTYIPYGAAMTLDGHIEAGALAYRAGPGRKPTLMPIEQLAELFQQDGYDPGRIRESVHALHAAGLLLVDDDGALHKNIPEPAAPWVPEPSRWRLTESAAIPGAAGR